MIKGKKWYIPLISGVAVIIMIILVERIVLPSIYQGIPLQFPRTGKPIGGILFPATFLHLLLGYGGIMIVFYSAKQAGFNMKGLVPSTKKGIIETISFLILLLSGLLVWWFPLALLPLVICGFYLIISEMK